MENTEQNIEQKMQGIDYYNIRLDYLISIYRDEGRENLDKNIDKIQRLVDNYQNFESDPKYNPVLGGIVKNFILRK
jgi:hypothetical protein